MNAYGWYMKLNVFARLWWCWKHRGRRTAYASFGALWRSSEYRNA